MTKKIRKLLGLILVACLLLSGVSALAKTGKMTMNLASKPENGFTNLKGVGFELFLVGTPTGEGTAWEPVKDFSAVTLLTEEPADGKNWSETEAKAIAEQVKKVLDAPNPPSPVNTGRPLVTNEKGQFTIDGLEPGIYFIRKKADSRPKLMVDAGGLFAIPSLSKTDPYDITINYNKYDYTTPPPTEFPVTKRWEDDDDFDEVRPTAVTARLHRYLGDADDEDEAFKDNTAPLVLNAENGWSGKWTDLETVNEDGVAYEYEVTEDPVDKYTGYVSTTGTQLINRHDVQYGALRVTKSVQLNGQPTTTTLADGTYKFTITGPAESPKSKNYINAEEFSIVVTGGKAGSWTRDKLMPGTYTIKETGELPVGMSVVDSAEKKIVVEAGKTAENPNTVDFVNNQVTASLKIVKNVTVNNQSTTDTAVDGTYHFTVKGPSYPNGTDVAIKVTGGKSNSKQLDGLKPGEYQVTEVKSNLPANVSYVSGDETKTLTVAHTAASPLTFTFTNNRNITTRTNPPSEAQPTPSATVPEATPSPTPLVDINGTKTWNDQGNVHNTRPNSITVRLLQNGTSIKEISVSGGNSNRWSYSFGSLPAVDNDGVKYDYKVDEVAVSGYTTRINGTSIANDLIEQPPKAYTSFTGTKVWRDNDNVNGDRPNYIVVRLLRNGSEVDRRTVTAANGWQFTFQNVPVDDGYGNTYHYSIREEGVSGYVGRVDGFIVTNSKLPERQPVVQPAKKRRTGTPKPAFKDFNEPELEELIELFDYQTPLWGQPLKTGDELPLYPIVFGGVGVAALIALVVLMSINKKRKQKAA